MNYIQEAQERVYKKFISEYGHRKVLKADYQVFQEIRATRMLGRKGLFGNTNTKWYNVIEDAGVI